jgi:GcrA cell cycle regulator
VIANQPSRSYASAMTRRRGETWNEENEDLLRRLWAEGLSGSDIARKLGKGFSANMVIGKSRRLGLERRPSPIKRS